MKLIDVDPRDLDPNPWNTNMVGPDNMVRLEESLRRHGWVRPVLTRRVGGRLQILGGQHRVEAAIRLGHATVPTLDLGEIEDVRAKEIGLIDNARYGADDALGLAELIAEIGQHVSITSFLPYSDAELAALGTSIDIDLDNLGEEPKPEPGERDKRPTKTHTVMRFKVALDDADQVAEVIEAIQGVHGFTDSDGLTNAGDALVYMARRLRELDEA